MARPDTLASVRSTALRLSPAKQAKLASDLLIHLAGPKSRAAKNPFGDEIAPADLSRRMKAFESGEDKGIPGPLALARARKAAGLPPRSPRRTA